MQRIRLYKGDALEVLSKRRGGSIDLIFADPPYNLSGKNHLTCKSGRTAICDKGQWDQVGNIHDFNRRWIHACVKVLKDEGTLWISGTLHNHPSVGVILKELGLWIINDIVWFKPNAPPLMKKNRLVPSTELIWVASRSKDYYFDYQLARTMNKNKQMRNLWVIPATRHKTKHPTEKPERLLERIILLGSKKNSVVLDPFMGSGTTGVVAKRFSRRFIGIEIDNDFFQIAKKRIENTVICNDLPYDRVRSRGVRVSQLSIDDGKGE